MCVSWAQLSGPCDRPPGCGASRSRSRVAQSPRLLVTQSLSQPDDPPSTQSVLWSAARRVRPRRTAPHGACGAMRHVGCSSRRTPASRRAFKLFKYESLEATCYYAMDRDNLLGCVGQCVHSPLGPDTRPVAA